MAERALAALAACRSLRPGGNDPQCRRIYHRHTSLSPSLNEPSFAQSNFHVRRHPIARNLTTEPMYVTVSPNERYVAATLYACVIVQHDPIPVTVLEDLKNQAIKHSVYVVDKKTSTVWVHSELRGAADIDAPGGTAIFHVVTYVARPSNVIVKHTPNYPLSNVIQRIRFPGETEDFAGRQPEMASRWTRKAMYHF